MANNTLNMIGFGRRPRFQMARRYAKLYQKRLAHRHASAQ
jgi:flagellar motor switch protein FliN